MFKVYLSDIHGKDIEIEKNVLKGIAKVIKGEAAKDRKKQTLNILKNAKDADAVGIRHTVVPEEVIKRLDNCRIIARFGGGFDNIDIKTATEKGIIVTYVPDYCTEAVAEQALTFSLVKIRELKKFEERIKKNFWSAQGIRTEMARDTTIGIIGLGRIGSALARKASCIGFNIVSYDPFINSKDYFKERNAQKKNLVDLLKISDIIVICAPLTKKEESKYPTYRMLGEREFEKMKEGAYIINVTRGEIIDIDILVSNLKKGKISGLATDVIEGEPPQNFYLRKGEYPVFDKLKKFPNVLITPHSSFSSTRSIRDVKEKGAMEIRSVLEGGFPRKIAWLNPEVKEKYLKKWKICYADR